MKVSPIQEVFNSGEFSPLMAARVRFQKYPNALAICKNMIPIVQGGVTRRSGTYHVVEVKDSSKATRVVQFEFSITQAYVIEMGNLYFRFCKDHGQIISGTPVEVVTPYLEADLFQLKFTQSADVLYITHPSYASRKLSRTSHTAWTLTTIDFLDGPYINVNTTSTTITPSATTGVGITLTASVALFAATDVGRLIRIQHSPTWGYAKITAFTSTTLVTADVKSDFAAITAVTSWRLGAWSTTTGFPSCVTFYEDRLCFGGGVSYPQRLDCSKSGLYENFAPTNTAGVVAADNAIAVTLNASNVNVIRWIIDDEKGLLIGTTGGEWIVRPSTQSEALTQTNVAAKRSTTSGSANIQCLRAGKAAIYIQRAGLKLRELAYVYQDDGFRSPDMTVLSEHITYSGIKEFEFQQEPQSILWCVRNDGEVAALTYERDQDVLGWHRHILGGAFGTGQAVVESVAVIPEPSGSYDECWFVVKRTINGSTKRYIEYMKKMWVGGDNKDDAFYVDSGLTYSGAAATIMSGLGHLEGQTVTILADGAAHPTKVVSGGAITLDRSATKAHIGLGYNSDVKTMRIEAGSQDGTAQGKTKRIHRVVARLFETLGLKAGPSEDNLRAISFRKTSDPTNDSPPLFTGDKEIVWDGDYEKEGQMFFRQDQPLPFTLLAIMPHMVTQDR